MQTQITTTKEPHTKEFKLKKANLVNVKLLTLLHINKFAKTSHMDKRKKYLKKKQDRKNTILTIKNNANVVEIIRRSKMIKAIKSFIIAKKKAIF